MKALAILALLEPRSKRCDDNDDVDLFTVLEERVDVSCVSILVTCLTISFVILGILSSEPRVNILTSIHDITCCVHLGGRVNLVQKFPCGSGK